MNNALGTKRTCPACTAKFYDFGKQELSCPKCSHTWAIAVVGEIKMDKPIPKPKKPKPVVYDDDGLDDMDDFGPVAELEALDDEDYEDVDHLEEVEDHHENPDIRVDSDDAEDEMFIDELEENGFQIVDDFGEDSEQRVDAY